MISAKKAKCPVTLVVRVLQPELILQYQLQMTIK
jgi:hypothetical protein